MSNLSTSSIKTLYVVSGFMRTGTSMMMRALEEGGMDAVYKQSRDVMKNRHADEHYDPNIGGLYELERADYKKPDFPRKYKGKLIKALSRGVPSMAVMKDGIKVIFMRRDKEEIRQSYNAFFGNPLNPNLNITKHLNDIKERILNRKDIISFDELWFRDVVNNPLLYFKHLKKVGWPIDPDKASSVVDANYLRFKQENLTIGII